MSQAKVIIYSGRFCGYCTAAERLFQSKKANYELIKVDEDQSKFDHMMEITGRRTVPQIFIDDFHVGGFDDLTALNQSGKLDELLNP
ncbi:Glutaredoxin 3 (Grx3) [hydrothermal vent metagenome]|uniref:Glutaredoxin 3 (Grx3) n=1 Tax=hydrothermal vent metagenome TaxID=652676 RepID=A0A3B0WML6_9ZZZZ